MNISGEPFQMNFNKFKKTLQELNYLPIKVSVKSLKSL